MEQLVSLSPKATLIRFAWICKPNVTTSSAPLSRMLSADLLPGSGGATADGGATLRTPGDGVRSLNSKATMLLGCTSCSDPLQKDGFAARYHVPFPKRFSKSMIIGSHLQSLLDCARRTLCPCMRVTGAEGSMSRCVRITCHAVERAFFDPCQPVVHANVSTNTLLPVVKCNNTVTTCRWLYGEDVDPVDGTFWAPGDL
eukprot:4037365-Amphidinium_carterae.1